MVKVKIRQGVGLDFNANIYKCRKYSLAKSYILLFPSGEVILLYYFPMASEGFGTPNIFVKFNEPN